MRARTIRFAVTIAAFAILAGTARADTIRVENHRDHGAGSLRQALADAADGDRVKVPAGDYGLRTGALDVTTDIEIEGAGQKKTVISGGGDSGVFAIASTAGPVTIETLTITRGRELLGGGIVNAGDLTLDHVAVKDNRADFGGGISSNGLLHIVSSKVAHNRAKAAFSFGGGIHAVPAAPGSPLELVLEESTLNENRAIGTQTGFGGGIYFDPSGSNGVLRIERSTVADNTARGKEDRGFGGGMHVSPVYNDPLTTSVELTESTLSGNLATGPGDGFGGGLFFQPIANNGIVSLSVENSTIYGNESIGLGAGRGFSGAMHLEPIANTPGLAPIVLSHATITKNRAVGTKIYGGALYVSQFEDPPLTMNTIVSGNTGAPFHDCLDPLNSAGGNLEGGTDCGFTESSDTQEEQPKLRDLAANGGPTKTAAPKALSPALDGGINDGCLSTDQRGVARPQGPLCDIGAFELEQ